MPRRRINRAYIRKWYRERSAVEIARRLGCQTQTVYQIAYEMGLCKQSHAMNWPAPQLIPKPRPARLPPNVIDGIPLARLMAGR